MEPISGLCALPILVLVLLGLILHAALSVPL